jgi:hypothetical protein
MQRRGQRAGHRLMALGAALLAASAAAGQPARADGDGERYVLRGELGEELDSNAHRTENVAGAIYVAPVSSPVTRVVLTGLLADNVAPGQDLAVSATLAGKLFSAAGARDEDVAIAQNALTWRWTLSPRAALAATGTYYEAFQRESQPLSNDRRDFRSLAPAARLGVAVGEGAEVGVGLGYRLFVFKPDRDFDFGAPTAGVDLRWARESADGGAEWEVLGDAAYERRAFAGPALVACPSDPGGVSCPPAVGTDLRTDNFLVARLQLARTGRVLVGGGYALQYNASNSFGETVMRHFVTARFAASLPGGLYVTARAELLLARYRDPVIVAQGNDVGRPFISIEDENRSSVRVDLSRNLTDRLQLIARYTFYANELGASQGTYRRQTALLSLAFTVEK